MTLYQPDHEWQLASIHSSVTRHSGCTWTSGATGADATTGGVKDRSPDYVKALVRPDEETNPHTPGWSLGDLRLAMSRLGVPFDNFSGQGWPKLVAEHDAGHYIVLQGDSDQFGNDTCSGAFDGDHAIGIRPVTTSPGGRWLIDDPICPTDRYELPSTLYRYARKLDSGIRFGAFRATVPQMPSGRWHAVIAAPGPKLREFFVYKVEDHDDRPLRIIDRATRRTGGVTLPCSAPRKAVRGPGWAGTPPSAGLVRLDDAFDGGWSYVDAKFAREI